MDTDLLLLSHFFLSFTPSSISSFFVSIASIPCGLYLISPVDFNGNPKKGLASMAAADSMDRLGEIIG